MKIIREHAAYIQKCDLIAMDRIGLPLPESIINKAYFPHTKPYSDPRTRLDFIKFEQANEIKLIKKLKWIPDLDELLNMTREELMEKARNILRRKRELENIKEWTDIILKNYELRTLEFECIRNFVWNERKDKHFSYKLPKEIKNESFCKKSGLKK